MQDNEKITKVRIELVSDKDEEIVIRCKEITPEIEKLKEKLEINELSHNRKLLLRLGNDEFVVDISNILYFESESNYVLVHTNSRIYNTNLKLYELESMLPRSFMRVSKSSVINLNKVSWYKRELTGNGFAGFANSTKQVNISRMYFKPFIENLKELRGIIK